MYSDTGNTTSLVLGFPIRTSSDPRSVDSSPRHIAASHVLHRLPVPRHPPCALKHLHTKQLKILGRIKNCIIKPNSPKDCRIDARNHYPQIKHHTPPPKQGNNNQPQRGATPKRGGYLPPVSHTRDEEIAGLLSQSPIVCLAVPSPQNPTRRLNPAAVQRLSCTRPDTHYRARPSNESTRSPNSHTRGRAWFSWCSLERR